MRSYKSLFIIFLFLPSLLWAQEAITKSILNDKDSFYYINTKDYPEGEKSLPIGVFDSGIGGLTVLDAIVNFDGFNNESLAAGADGEIDFKKEEFIYLADQANMPYGNYSAENKDALLLEHILKDVQFILGNKYYTSPESQTFSTDKSPIKALVIACNTATAYGKENIEAFMKLAELDIKVIGVIDAGVRGSLEKLEHDEDATIAVMATAGTVSSKGYVNTLYEQKDKLGYTGNIEVFQQGGVGIAEAVDEDSDYFDKELTEPRESYKGPDLKGNLKIDKALMDIYNFDYDDFKMLCDTQASDDCNILQINDAENYVRYHLVSLMEKIRKANVQQPLKSIILGCTHYPYLTREIDRVLNELYNYREDDGSLRYRRFMTKDIDLIDPAVNTALELFQHLKEEKLFNENGNINNSEFYISVPNQDNPNIITNEKGDFPYEYKYGRSEGEIQEYVKVVPFSRRSISADIFSRLEFQLPFTYNLIEKFIDNGTKIGR
ncbi:glutamate racemase [Salegentibacter agarivorans]|uniref:Glutamate racemase n=1 Tax=Salegentibacter agarivorans TaxID=345907 RepID=A0A1I2NKX4_9FLAO|nr:MULTISPECIES: aspartate/glutamate racemase family protein [Salegentibacter]APS40499.1 Asp/Glu/hydantoin racemase [Salegentibacter sp. T436]SFG04534.1 glutamate racemase [Salegentibacter agarivorans]